MNSIPAAIVIVSVVMTAGAAIIVAKRPLPKMLNPAIEEDKKMHRPFITARKYFVPEI